MSGLMRSRLVGQLAYLSARQTAPRACAVRLAHVASNGPAVLASAVQQQHPAWRGTVCRHFSTELSQSEVESRVIAVCKAFDKITADKLDVKSHFINDLGLDSLDHVEVIMAIEDEFGFEIPDEHAEKLITPDHIVQYIVDKQDL